MTDAFANRVKKNEKHLRKWAKRHSFDAFRVYDRDVPEFPFIVDKFGDSWVLYDRGDDPAAAEAAAASLQAVMELAPDRVVLKKRERQKGSAQYEKLGESRSFEEIREGELKLLINLRDYLDCGLFLDHRPLRQELASDPHLQGAKVLNLFCYTGSISVAAAFAGATVTSVDLSNTYLNWAKQNMEINGMSKAGHRFVRADVKPWLAEHPKDQRYDVIVLDPPTFSNSKSMNYTFDIKKQHGELIDLCMPLLNLGGRLLFSTNARSFRLDPLLAERFAVEDRSAVSIPQDFRDNKIHRLFCIRHPDEI